MGSIAEQCRLIRLAVLKWEGVNIQQQTASVKEAAAMLEVSQAEVRRLLGSGLLRVTLFGRQHRIPIYLIDRLRPR